MTAQGHPRTIFKRAIQREEGGGYRRCYGAVETGRTDREFERALERRFNAEDPSWRWKAEAFTPSWVQVFPVYSRVRTLYRRSRGWSLDPDYVGAWVFVRRSDGLVVELGSHFLLWFEVFEGVFRDIGQTAGAEEITAEIIARSEGYPDEQGLAFEDDDELAEILRQRDRDGAFGHGGEAPPETLDARRGQRT